MNTVPFSCLFEPKRFARASRVIAGAASAYLMVSYSAAAPAPTACNAAATWLVQAETMSLEEKVALYALQGIANRQKPRVFVRLGPASRWMDFEYRLAEKKENPVWNPAVVDRFEKEYPSIEDYWVTYLRAKGQAVFTPATLPVVIKAMGPEIKGWIRYEDPATDISPAATLAGLEDAVPVTPALQERLEAEGVRLPVVFDYSAVRKAFPNGSDPRLEAHRWAIKELLPRCQKNGLVSRDRTYNSDLHDTLVDIDLATQNRWFVYDLSHAADENKSDARFAPNPQEQPILEELLSKITPFSPAYGWGRPEEQHFIRSLSRHRLLGICSGVPNNSFFARLPAPKGPFKQKSGHHEKVTLEEKVYVAFMTNEGDSIKAANGLMCEGSWIQPERGTIPINWGIDPFLVKEFPGLMSYYYETMTPNDYFFAASSGWGYTHPPFIPEDSLGKYADLVRLGGVIADVRYVDIWYVNALRERLHPFLKATGMKGLTDWDNSQQSVQYTDYGLTVIKSNHYYTLDDPAKFASMLVEDMKPVSGPWFIIVYGARVHGTPYKFAEVARRLPPEKFKIVKLDEFFAAADLAKAKMQGRVWRPGPNAPKGVAP